MGKKGKRGEGRSRSAAPKNTQRIIFGVLFAVGMFLLFLNIVNPDGICSFGDGWGIRDCSETSGSPEQMDFQLDETDCETLPPAMGIALGCPPTE